MEDMETNGRVYHIPTFRLTTMAENISAHPDFHPLARTALPFPVPQISIYLPHPLFLKQLAITEGSGAISQMDDQ